MRLPRDYTPTTRFSDRVSDYERYRPGYPPALVDWLMAVSGIKPGDAAADIGAGTGLFTQLLLHAGLRVFGVEPNAPMLAAAVRQFAGEANFVPVDGTAECTSLPSQSVRLVTVAQAFHWFDIPAARAECARILQPTGGVALIWNVRRIDSAFAHSYEQLLLSHCPDYADGVPKQAGRESVSAFFGHEDHCSEVFDNLQVLDLDGLRGRLLSSSYTPKADDPARGPLLEALADLFSAHEHDGCLTFGYDTRVFFGRL